MSSEWKRKLDINDEEQVPKKRIGDQNSEEKISKLIDAVLQQGPLGNVVFILPEVENNPYVILQNCLSPMNFNLTFTKCTERNIYELKINETLYAEGCFESMQAAKRFLAAEALEKLRDTCFFIQKKPDYVNVTQENLHECSSSKQLDMHVETNDSVAHRIMLKMGWTGGGLGLKQQGSLDSVVLYENVNRQGLGTHNLVKEITKKLDDFSKSSELLTLVFDSSFSKEDRALIHRLARKLNLKSKSTGSEDRKLTVSRKVTKITIVRELLKLGGEDGLYKLYIPKKFSHLWN